MATYPRYTPRSPNSLRQANGIVQRFMGSWKKTLVIGNGIDPTACTTYRYLIVESDVNIVETLQCQIINTTCAGERHYQLKDKLYCFCHTPKNLTCSVFYEEGEDVLVEVRDMP